MNDETMKSIENIENDNEMSEEFSSVCELMTDLYSDD